MSLLALSQDGFLFDLPLPALYSILHRVGPRSRELCRALLDLYGPLPRLTPRGLQTPGDLLSSLASNDRYLHLAALDLTHVDVTDDVFVELCQALPNLQTLRLPTWWDNGCKLTAPAVAAATSHLPRLTALHVPFLADVRSHPDPADPLPEWPIQGCAPELQELVLPTPLAASSTPALSRLSRLSKLSFQGHCRIDMSHVTSLVAHLPALVALELGGNFSDAVSDLRGLTRLTALKLSGWVCEAGVTQGQLLQHVGTLTRLRSLHLQLYLDDGTAQPGWLTRLSLLTCLRLDLGEGLEDVPSFDEIAASVPHLPALRSLHIADIDGSKGAGGALSAAACARIASARSGLRGLHLTGLSLPPAMFTDVLPVLSGLTYMGLDCHAADHGGGQPFSWLAALTALRELRYFGDPRGVADGSVLPCQLLAGLSSMDALTLAACSFVDAPYLAQLCASMPQLTSLDLSDNANMGAGLSALRHLANLEVLGLGSIAYSADLLQHVRPLVSLRRCYLGEQWGPEEQAAASAALGGRVQAVFSVWEQDWHSGG